MIKNSKKRILIFAAYILLFAGYTYVNFNASLTPSDHATNDVIDKVTKKLNGFYPLTISGFGGSEDEEGISEIAVMYRHYGKPIDLEYGRIIIVNVIQAYLDEVNSNKKIRPFLKNYPFTIENLDLAVISFSKNGKDYFDPLLDTISNINNVIDYSTRDADNYLNYKQTTTETYDEAYKIVKDSGQLLSFE